LTFKINIFGPGCSDLVLSYGDNLGEKYGDFAAVEIDKTARG